MNELSPEGEVNLPVLTPHDVESGIQRALKQLREANEALPDIAREAAEAEVAYRVGFAKRRIIARADQTRRVTDKEADDIATRESEDLLLKRKLADHRLLVQREAIRSLQERLGGIRTIAAGLRAEVNG